MSSSFLPEFPPHNNRSYTIQVKNGQMSWFPIESDTITPKKRVRKLVVIAGQSNGAGSSTEKVATKPINPRLKQWSRGKGTCFDGTPIRYDPGTPGDIIPAQHPLQARGICGPDATGFGIEFGEQYLVDHPECDELIIMNCCLGGTGFRPSQGWVVTWDHRMKDAHMNLAQLTFNDVDALLSKEPDIELLCLLWHQGENDLGYWPYPDKLVDFFRTFRQVVSMPQLPIIVGTMSVDFKNANPSGTQYIDTTHKCIAYFMDDTKFCACANLDHIHGVTPDGMNVHFTADGYVHAGKEFYTTFKNMMMTNANTVLSRGLDEETTHYTESPIMITWKEQKQEIVNKAIRGIDLCDSSLNYANVDVLGRALFESPFPVPSS